VKSGGRVAQDILAEVLAHALLAELLQALESEPDLTARLRALLGSSASDDWITLKEARVSVRTLRAAIRRGDLAASKIGRNYRIRRADLDAWIASREIDIPAEERSSSEEQSPAERAIARASAAGKLRAVKDKPN